MDTSSKPLKLVTKRQEIAEGVVATLKNMLELAEAGEITGVAVAAIDREGFTHTAYEPGENMGLLIGACERVKFRLLMDQDPD